MSNLLRSNTCAWRSRLRVRQVPALPRPPVVRAQPSRAPGPRAAGRASDRWRLWETGDRAAVAVGGTRVLAQGSPVWTHGHSGGGSRCLRYLPNTWPLPKMDPQKERENNHREKRAGVSQSTSRVVSGVNIRGETWRILNMIDFRNCSEMLAGNSHEF